MNVLNDILDGVREDVAQRMQRVPLEHVKERASMTSAPRDPRPTFTDEDVCVIAEVKRESPSRGPLAEIADPAALACDYEAGGAHCISVLTEERRFGGSLDDLASVRAAVDVPVLRKDFIIDPWQVFETRAMGADAVLLIVAALSDAQLDQLYHAAQRAGCDVLVEVHTADELARALKLNIELIDSNECALCHGFGTPTALRLLRPVQALLMVRASLEAQLAHAPARRPWLISRSGMPPLPLRPCLTKQISQMALHGQLPERLRTSAKASGIWVC